MPRVLIAPDKFKGTLPAAGVAAAIARGLRRAVPDVRIVECPIADGGDGTVAAAVAAGFSYVPVTASGPLGEPVETGYARQGETAIVELAAVAGLSMLAEPAPWTSTTLGVGEVLARAIGDGCREIVLGLGGSASTDGGAGMLRGLGVRFLDASGAEIPLGAKGLPSLARIDTSGLDLHGARVVLAGDVDNPLLGPDGAAAVYGPQKGASPQDVELLDKALAHFASVVGPDAASAPGAGAAGGVGFGALAMLDARFRPGIDVVLEMAGFAEKLHGVDLVITGEGSFDEQTLHGKGPAGIAARAAGIPVIAVAGRLELDAKTLRHNGFAGAYALTSVEPDVRRCMTDTAAVLEELAERLAAEWLQANSVFHSSSDFGR